jgi:protein-disulfide isomerase
MKSDGKSGRIETVAFVLIAITSTITAGVVLYRTFVPSGPPRPTASNEPAYIADWEEIVGDGLHAGDPSAPVQIVTFTDLECPFCRRFHAVVTDLAEKRSDIALTWLHFPLSRHRFARPAAHAAECAADQGRFGEYLDVVYERQDSLGLTSWTEFAALAGVTDKTRFAECLESDSVPPRIQLGLDAARRVGATGTPTVLINGWRISPPYSEDDLDRAIADAIEREVPGGA